MKASYSITCVCAVLACLSLAACARQKDHAQSAIADIEAAVQAAGPEAQRYVPDRLADVKTQLDSLKASFRDEHYSSVVSGAPAVLESAKDLTGAAEEKRKQEHIELAARWSSLAAAMPRAIESIDQRIATLDRSRRLPHGIDHQRLASAAVSLKEAKGSWAKASSEFAGGHVDDAVGQGEKVQKEAKVLMSELGMSTKASAHS
jgi:hypothetical protein